MWRSEPGAFVPSSVSVSKGLKLNGLMKAEETFLLERFLIVIPEFCDRPHGTKLRLDLKLQVDVQTLRMWFLFTPLETLGRCWDPLIG